MQGFALFAFTVMQISSLLTTPAQSKDIQLEHKILGLMDIFRLRILQLESPCAGHTASENCTRRVVSHTPCSGYRGRCVTKEARRKQSDQERTTTN